MNYGPLDFSITESNNYHVEYLKKHTEYMDPLYTN